MDKRIYIKPAIEVVLIQGEILLAASTLTTSINDAATPQETVIFDAKENFFSDDSDFGEE